MIDQFIEWHDSIESEIGLIGSILSAKLSDEPEELIRDLQNAEAWNARTGYLLAEANSWLDRFSLFAMPTKEGRSEADRRVLLDSETSAIRMVRDTLEHYCNCIKNRLILGESILSYVKQTYADRKGRETLEAV